MSTEYRQELNWYAVHTKPASESQAAANIRRLSLEVFLPEIKRVKHAWGKTVVTVKPLFPRYLFACFSPSPDLHHIRYARGVSRVISAGLVPIPLSDEVVEMIRDRVGEDGFVRLGPGQLMAGDKVLIDDGPLRGLEGVFERDLTHGERVVILLKTLEYQASVIVERHTLRPAAKGH